MPERKFEAYPENAAGSFYVECNRCIACMAPQSVAPDLIGFCEDPSGNNTSHCYFKKQPQTKEELDRAVKAVHACCVDSYRYAGSDPDVMNMLERANCDHAIDQKNRSL